MEFFKNRLIQAEDYILHLEREKERVEILLENTTADAHQMRIDLGTISQQLDDARLEKTGLIKTIDDLSSQNDKLSSEVQSGLVRKGSNEDATQIKNELNQLKS